MAPQPFLDSLLNPETTPLVILAEGCFGRRDSKTAIGVIRYGKWPITAIIDSSKAGQRVRDMVQGTCMAPIVASVQEAISCSPKPKALLVGTAPMGGGLPDDFKAIIREALQAGLHVISGLHVFLNRQPDLRALADQHQVMLWDVRDVPEKNLVTRQIPRPAGTRVITMVGSDCSIGKMTVALEITRALQAKGEAAEFVATGQTGIMIAGGGVPLDRVIGDFMAGYMEEAIDRVIQDRKPKWVIVEGQGSLLHPAYSGVTLSLLHGSAPDAMVLCHRPGQTGIHQFESVKIPSLTDLIALYEQAAGWIKPAKIVGIALNTSACTEQEARQAVQGAESETGLPATDPVRFGAEKLVKALEEGVML